LFAAGTDWVTTGIGRSLTAIPGHFGFAVIMGYFFSLNHFDRYRSPGAAWKMWLYPVLAHGIYDTVAMMAEVTPQLSGVITIAILLFCFQMVKWARESMRNHLIADSSDATTGGGIDEQ
ncbi:MAG: PrsW family intramembrane metalloprotease, partial [Bacteroidales bacterium]|nr:PrsW family intramembrane metalloprotease [Bacteroidales bacterium]